MNPLPSRAELTGESPVLVLTRSAGQRHSQRSRHFTNVNVLRRFTITYTPNNIQFLSAHKIITSESVQVSGQNQTMSYLRQR